MTDYSFEMRMWEKLLNSIVNAIKNIDVVEDMGNLFNDWKNLINTVKENNIPLTKDDVEQLQGINEQIYKLQEHEYEVLTADRESSFYNMQLDAEINDIPFLADNANVNNYDRLLMQEYESSYLSSEESITLADYKELPLDVKFDLDSDISKDRFVNFTKNYESNVSFLEDKLKEIDQKHNVDVSETAPSRWRNMEIEQTIDIDFK